MFCAAYKIYGQKVPIVDILVGIIQNEYGAKWNNQKASFMSSLKHQLVLYDAFEEYKTTEGNTQL